MADPFALLEITLDSELEKIKRLVIDKARKSVVLGDGPDEDTVIEVSMEVDLNAILRAATSSSSIREVQREQGEEDHSPTEEPRN